MRGTRKITNIELSDKSDWKSGRFFQTMNGWQELIRLLFDAVGIAGVERNVFS